MLGCKPSPNGEASSIPRISDQPFSHKLIRAPVVISELHFILFLNFYLKPSSSWISDLEKKKSSQSSQRPLAVCPPATSHYLWPPVLCLPLHCTPAALNRRPEACSHLGGYALAVFSTQEAPSLEIHGLVPPPPSSFSLNVSFSLRSFLNSPFKFEAAYHPSSQFPAFFFFVILSTTQTSRHLRRLLTCFLSFSLH